MKAEAKTPKKEREATAQAKRRASSSVIGA
jgi:hypothetical protein